jgi:hypothetical protein
VILRCLLLLVVAALSGCGNLVQSDEPLFSKATAGAPPKLKPGLWRSVEPSCQVDVDETVSRWPDCAAAMPVGQDGLMEVDEDSELLVVDGDPLVLQMGPPEAEAGATYSYMAMKPARHDRRGRVLEFGAWWVVCGPPPPAGPAPEKGSRERRVTLEPLPGLEIRGDDCIARDPEAVRRAARASEAWSVRLTYQWVRPLRFGEAKWLASR